MHRHGPSRLRGPRAARGRPSAAGGPAASVPPVDSSDSTSPGRPPADAPVRADLVARLRREIAAGMYETPEKLQAALQRLLRELEPE